MRDIHINKILEGKDKKTNNNLFIFCHFDAANKISENTIHYLKDIYDNCDGDIIFVTNSEKLPANEISKVENFCKKIIIRNNIGYDFAAYYSGFVQAENKENYKNIIFANDSVFGPFYSLRKVFDKMAPIQCDAWCITDNIFPNPHMQSYFLVFRNSALKFLNEFYSSFEYLSDKEEIIKKYEIGFSNEFKKAGLNFAALCKHEEMIGFEKISNDEILKDLKSTILENVRLRKIKRLKALFSKKSKQELEERKFLGVYGSPHLNMWYTSIRYFGNPFIKTSLVKSPKQIYRHNFIYKVLIKQLYPDYKIGF